MIDCMEGHGFGERVLNFASAYELAITNNLFLEERKTLYYTVKKSTNPHFFQN